ncbi:MAG: hypothetical protein ACI9P7_001176 [Candidatus Azotimanducaceae bacterium]|jgi:hypothetical protein
MSAPACYENLWWKAAVAMQEYVSAVKILLKVADGRSLDVAISLRGFEKLLLSICMP